jgi:gas vesicle protein
MSRITQIVARQVGTIQANLTSQIQGSVSNILSKFNNQCPSQEELVSIIKTKNNLSKVINSYERRVSRLKQIGRQLQPAVTSARVSINIIKRIPRPTVFTIIPPQAGGVVLGVPFSALTALGDRLIQLDKLLSSLQNDIKGVNQAVDSSNTLFKNLKELLNRIDQAVNQCNSEITENSILLNNLQKEDRMEVENLEDSDLTYKGFTLEIVTDINAPEIAPRRFAVAKDRRGIVVLRGQPSFSSSIEVLLDEIRFRIDNRLS